MAEIPFGVGKTITFEMGDEEKVEDDAGPPPRSSSENGECSGPFEAELGDIAADPASLWDARLGLFNVAAAEVGELTPAQLVGCVERFTAMHGGGE